MAEKLTYKEQLRHPFWQRKRLEVLGKAHFACQRCFDTETTLNVHHKRYVKGRMAWEYEDIELEAVCEECHRLEHEGSDLLGDVLVRVPHVFRDEIAHLIATYLGNTIIAGMEGRFQEIPALHAGFVARSVSSYPGEAIDSICAAIDAAYPILCDPIPEDHMLAISVIHVDPEKQGE